MLTNKENEICMKLLAISNHMKSKLHLDIYKENYNFYKAIIPEIRKELKKINENNKISEEEKDNKLKKVITKWITDKWVEYPRCKNHIEKFQKKYKLDKSKN